MLQTNLAPHFLASPPRQLCLGKLAAVWVAYGFGMAVLWQLPVGQAGAAHAALWVIAGLLGVGIAFGLKEA